MNPITSFIIENIKSMKFWMVIIIAFIILLFLFPYIDANIFYYSRMEKRIDILSSLLVIDYDSIKDNSILLNEYNALLDELNSQRGKVLTNIVLDADAASSEPSSVRFFKFITGGFWGWLIIICIPFMKTFNNKKDKLIAFIVIAFIATLLGFIASVIPTIGAPIVNYIGFNILFLILIIMIVFIINNKKETEEPAEK